MRNELIKITSNFKSPLGHEESINLFVKAIQKLLQDIIPFSVIPEHPDPQKCIEYFEKFHREMPLVSWSGFDSNHKTILISCICDAYHTQGMGRFMCDLFSHWIVPGKQLPIVNVRSLNFHFDHYPEVNYFINTLILDISGEKDTALIKTKLPIVSKELKLNISSVQHIRQVVSIKPLTLEQKKILIQENISSLIDRSVKELNPCIYDLMHQLLIKASADQKMTFIKDQLDPLVQLKPTAFDRDIYPEVQRYVSNLKDSFIVARELKHLNRVISYHYILRKHLSNLLYLKPKKRHLSIKLLRTKILYPNRSYPILGFIIGITLIRENELFEEKHVLKAIQSLLPHTVKVDHSLIIEKTDNNKVITIYLEVKKEDESSFTSLELKHLKLKLPREIKHRIESVMNPIFVHRNEEEVMRNILDLSKQLKYIHDLPQVIINFHKQTAFEISFLVILLRLIKPNEKSIKEIFHTSSTILKLYDHDVRMVGILRKRYPKEANVFEIRLDKKQFLRKDFSLDLYKARLCIISELTRLLGDIRDYNGGMIAKQHEVLSELKSLLVKENIRNDFLLENFFYSITPNYMQSLLSPVVLKELFLKLLSVLEHDFNIDKFYMQTTIYDDYYLLMLGAIQPSFNKFISSLLEELLTSCHEFTHSFVNVYDITCIGFLLKFEKTEEYHLFEQHIVQALKRWELQTYKDPDEDMSPSLISKLSY